MVKKNSPNFASLTLQTLLLVVSLCGLAAAIDVSDADIDSSGKVDFNDFAVMGQFWLETYSAGPDSEPWVDVRCPLILNETVINSTKKSGDTLWMYNHGCGRLPFGFYVLKAGVTGYFQWAGRLTRSRLL